MSDLKTAILDAKYIDMIGLADFIVKDCALPDVDADGNLVSGQTEIAAAIFRWAVSYQDHDAAAARLAPEPDTEISKDRGQDSAPLLKQEGGQRP